MLSMILLFSMVTVWMILWITSQATTFISELTEGVCGDRIPTFFMRGNHEIRNAYSIGLRDHFDYVGDKTYASFNWGDTRIVMLDYWRR